MRYTPIFSLTILLTCFSYSLHAGIVKINETDEPVKILSEIELFHLNDQNLSLQELRSKSFLKHESWKDQILANEVYWGRFEIENLRPSTSLDVSWVIEFPITLTEISVFTFYEDGQIKKQKTGQFVPINERTFAPIQKANLIQINIQNQEKATIYFKAKCNRKNATPKFNLQLFSADYFFNHLKTIRLRQGLFIGFMLMMLVYNLFLYFFDAKDKTYLYYSIYIFGIVLYSSYNSGVLADITNSLFIPSIPKYAYLGKTSTYLVIFGYLYFLRYFLGLKQLLPTWDKLLQGLLWTNAIAFFLDVSLMLLTNFNSDLSDIVTVGNAIIFVLFIFILCIVLYPIKNKSSYFIIGGIVLMGVGAVFTIIARIRGVVYSTVPFQIGTVMEVIIFSLGLAYRRKTIEKEKHQAQFDLEKTELLRAQEKMEVEKLKEVEKFKSRLYTNITHEFRTALTIINGNLEFIKDHEQEKDIIKRNSDQMLRLINQMLDLSKMEANLLEVNLIQSDIVIFLQYITESFYSLASVKNIRLNYYSEDREILMDFDKDKMEHILNNLISNAVKFTSSGGKIVVHLKKKMIDENHMLQIKVKDNGCGITESQLPFIFDRFKNKANNYDTGTGIGLAFVKELTNLLEGEISVKSEVDIGTEFKILLPIRNKNMLVELPILEDSILVTREKEHSQLSKSEDESLPILLLIEDNHDVSNYVAKLLQSQYHVHHAFDGQEGLEKAIEIIPDIILSDVIMPKIDGYQVTRMIKANNKTSHIPIILLTAKATQTDKNDGLISGADSYLLKPFNKDELLIRLNNIILQRKVLIEKFQAVFFNEGGQITSLVTKEHQFIKAIEEKLKERIDDPNFGVDGLCIHMDLNKNQFYRKVKAITGQTPTQFIRDIRLYEAQRLLQEKDLNISEIAYRVGFKDPNYFSRMFHKKFGITPRQFLSK